MLRTVGGDPGRRFPPSFCTRRHFYAPTTPRRTPGTRSMSDLEPKVDLVLRRAVAGDAVAFEQLCLVHYARLRGLAEHLIPQDLRTHIDADDLLQDAYYEAFLSRASATLPDHAAAFAWLSAILRHRLGKLSAAYRTLKRGGGVAQLVGPVRSDDEVEDLLAALAQYRRTPSASAVGHETVRIIEASIDTLSSDHRQAIVLRYIEGHPFREVAAIMQRSESAVTTLCRRAVQALREQLGPESSYF